MDYSRKFLTASSVAGALLLAGCGGGAGGGVAFIPQPPSTPTPPPTPAGSVGAPIMALVPNGNLFPVATVGGPTLQSHVSTVFPLLETVMTTDSTGAHADTATTKAGGTLTFSSNPDDYTIDIGNPALGISKQPLEQDWCGYCATAGSGHVYVHIADPATSNLAWTSYGMWGFHVDSGAPSTTSAAFVTGYKTPNGSVPKTGTATFAGSVVGQVIYPQAGVENGIGSANLTGNASLQANFATGAITGDLTHMAAGSVPWNSVSLQGSIATGENYFSGSSAATSAPSNSTSLSSSATGTFAGMFFGPSAQELGAVWTLSDGTRSAIGSIGASKNSSGAGQWDY